VTTLVTCPTVRLHPAVTAQAAATSSVLTDGGFALGVGTGEALNEHILGGPWPEYQVRAEMLEEAIEVMRALFTGERTSHHGRYPRLRSGRRPIADPDAGRFVGAAPARSDRDARAVHTH
jgi:G6PDH family F420-dependent oxidoreductase